MGEAVVITPSIIVVISFVRWNQFFNELLQILDQTRLLLDGRQGGGGTGYKKRHDPAVDFFLVDLFANFGGDIDDVTESGGFFDEFLGVNLDHAIDVPLNL